ncbi:hypothetical protein [Caballeronia sp. BCC1704]|uniref:hypothetical protein n=1 Tax=Caballeronia sp. BCC1704 TaxID=2676300 RepID=UPI00158B1789|nr:hypothetical protein [Caballeronia sp. BCC1704]
MKAPKAGKDLTITARCSAPSELLRELIGESRDAWTRVELDCGEMPAKAAEAISSAIRGDSAAHAPVPVLKIDIVARAWGRQKLPVGRDSQARSPKVEAEKIGSWLRGFDLPNAGEAFKSFLPHSRFGGYKTVPIPIALARMGAISLPEANRMLEEERHALGERGFVDELASMPRDPFEDTPEYMAALMSLRPDMDRARARWKARLEAEALRAGVDEASSDAAPARNPRRL